MLATDQGTERCGFGELPVAGARRGPEVVKAIPDLDQFEEPVVIDPEDHIRNRCRPTVSHGQFETRVSTVSAGPLDDPVLSRQMSRVVGEWSIEIPAEGHTQWAGERQTDAYPEVKRRHGAVTTFELRVSRPRDADLGSNTCLGTPSAAARGSCLLADGRGDAPRLDRRVGRER